jgi:hypothetical protein
MLDASATLRCRRRELDHWWILARGALRGGSRSPDSRGIRASGDITYLNFSDGRAHAAAAEAQPSDEVGLLEGSHRTDDSIYGSLPST